MHRSRSVPRRKDGKDAGACWNGRKAAKDGDKVVKGVRHPRHQANQAAHDHRKGGCQALHEPFVGTTEGFGSAFRPAWEAMP